MTDAWRQLERAGVPMGATGHAHREPVVVATLIDPLRKVLAGPLAPGARDALAAWLGALRSHWPTAYAGLMAEVATPSFDDVEPNRFLKLRRIALANLAGRL